MLYSDLQTYVSKLLLESKNISKTRKTRLDQLIHYLQTKIDDGQAIQLNFICTHNSRRSQISQIWAATAAAYFGIDQVKTYSGGTAVTTFNPRAVAAMERIGFEIGHLPIENPHYLVSFSRQKEAIECFSKTFDDAYNPQKDFAAIMTCTDADKNCPLISGVSFRLSLPYKDPKIADDTPKESKIYDERVRQIGRELFYVFNALKNVY